jgi:hypothetical protein
MEAQAELFPEAAGIVPAQRLSGRVAGLYIAASGGFQTSPIDAITLGFGGIAGDVHEGVTRRAAGREPWYPRGTEMRNERQVSIVAPDEMALIAQRMGLGELRPEWIGANILLAGVPRLSMLPAGSKLFFAGGATLKIDRQNKPCRISGRSIAANAGLADEAAVALRFVEVAGRLRGLVGWVEMPGRVAAGEEVTVKVPEQWIYRG